MTIAPGDTGHVAEHNSLRLAVNNSDATTAARVDDTGTATGAALAVTFAGLPTVDLGDDAVLMRDTGEARGVSWTTKEELVARALGWTVVTDPQWAGGAVGDGVANDTAAIQAAVTAATSVVWFPVGTYLVTSQITVANASLVLRGAGKKATTVTTANDVTIFEVTGHFVSFETMRFAVTNTGRTKYSIRFNTVNQGEVSNCYFDGASGARVSGVYFLDGSMGLIDGCTFNHSCIRVETWDVKITRSWVWAMTCDFGIGIYSGAGNTTIENVDVVPPLLSTATGLAGIYVDGASGKALNTTMSTIYLDGNPSLVTRMGIYLGDGTGATEINGVKANKMDAESIVVDSAYNVLIRGYTGYGNNQSGTGASEILIKQTGVQPVENVRISGAQFLQTAAVTGSAGPAVKVDSPVSANEVTIFDFDVKQPTGGGGYSLPEIVAPATTRIDGRGKLSVYKARGSQTVTAGSSSATINLSATYPMAYPPTPAQVKLNSGSGQSLPNNRLQVNNGGNPNQVFVNFATALAADITLFWEVSLA